MAESVMTYNDETHELVCYAPPGEELLRIATPSFTTAHVISAAIQEAYRKGSLLGRLELQRCVEQRMDELNAK